MEYAEEYSEHYRARLTGLKHALGALNAVLGEDGTATWEECPPARVIVTPRNRRSAVLEARIDDDYVAVRVGEYGEVALAGSDTSTYSAGLHSLVVEMLEAELVEEVQLDMFGRVLSTRIMIREERRLRLVGVSGFRVPLWRVRRRVYPPYRSHWA